MAAKASPARSAQARYPTATVASGAATVVSGPRAAVVKARGAPRRDARDKWSTDTPVPKTRPERRTEPPSRHALVELGGGHKKQAGGDHPERRGNHLPGEHHRIAPRGRPYLEPELLDEVVECMTSVCDPRAKLPGPDSCRPAYTTLPRTSSTRASPSPCGRPRPWSSRTRPGCPSSPRRRGAAAGRSRAPAPSSRARRGRRCVAARRR